MVWCEWNDWYEPYDGMECEQLMCSYGRMTEKKGVWSYCANRVVPCVAGQASWVGGRILQLDDGSYRPEYLVMLDRYTHLFIVIGLDLNPQSGMYKAMLLWADPFLESI